jgi:hypothetical protein
MRPLDIPEILIGLGLIATFVWGVYNWMHQRTTR